MTQEYPEGEYSDSLGSDALGADSPGIDSSDSTEQDLASPLLHPSNVQRLENTLRQLSHGSTDVSGHTGPPSEITQNATIGKFKVLRMLSCGGQATVLLAFDPDLRREVVIKLYNHAMTSTDNERMIREGRALARIRNPHVATCFGADDLDGIPYLVLEYVPGKTLSEIIAARRLSRRESLDYVGQVAAGMVAAHEIGLVHRDIKPSNVIVGNDGVAKLIDFGLVQSLVDPLAADQSGTLAYMAPEIARGDVDLVDQRSDVFGLGATLYHLLSGRPPFAADSKSESLELARNCQFTSLASSPFLASKLINRLCARCMERDVSQRIQSAAELSQEIEKVKSFHKRWIARLAATAVLLVAVFLSFAWIVRSERPHDRLATSSTSIPELIAAMHSRENDAALRCRFMDFDGNEISPDLTGSYEFPHDKPFWIDVQSEQACYLSIYHIALRSRSSQPIADESRFASTGSYTRVFEGKTDALTWNSLILPNTGDNYGSEYVFLDASSVPRKTELWSPDAANEGLLGTYLVQFNRTPSDPGKAAIAQKSLLIQSYEASRDREFERSYEYLVEYLDTFEEDLIEDWKTSRQLLVRFAGKLALCQRRFSEATDWFQSNLKQARKTGSNVRLVQADLDAIRWIEQLAKRDREAILVALENTVAGFGLYQTKYLPDASYVHEDWKMAFDKNSRARMLFESEPELASFRWDNLKNLSEIAYDLNQGETTFDEDYLGACQDLLGPDNVITINTLQGLTVTLSYEKSIEPALEVLAKAKAHLPAHHPLIATIAYELGFTYKEVGQLAKAKRYYEEALDVFESEDHPQVALILARMSDVAALESDDEKSLDLARRSVQIMDDCGPQRYFIDDYLRTRVYLADAISRCEGPEAGLAEYEALTKIAWDYYHDRPSMAGFLGSYAVVLNRAGQYEAALSKADFAMLIYRRYLETCPYVQGEMEELRLIREESINGMSKQ